MPCYCTNMLPYVCTGEFCRSKWVRIRGVCTFSAHLYTHNIYTFINIFEDIDYVMSFYIHRPPHAPRWIFFAFILLHILGIRPNTVGDRSAKEVKKKIAVYFWANFPSTFLLSFAWLCWFNEKKSTNEWCNDEEELSFVLFGWSILMILFVRTGTANAPSAPASHHFVFTFHQIIIIIIDRNVYLDICLITTVERSINWYTE